MHVKQRKLPNQRSHSKKNATTKKLFLNKRNKFIDKTVFIYAAKKLCAFFGVFMTFLLHDNKNEAKMLNSNSMLKGFYQNKKITSTTEVM